MWSALTRDLRFPTLNAPILAATILAATNDKTGPNQQDETPSIG